MNCHYCGKEVTIESGKYVYPHRPDLYKLNFYVCKPCEAYVGCHKNTTTPLGTVANAELRQHRSLCHTVFDPMWRNGSMTRSEAYSWLSTNLNIPKNKCHIAMFNTAQCDQLLTLLNIEH